MSRKVRGYVLMGCQAFGAASFFAGLLMLAGPAWTMLVSGAIVTGVAVLAEMRS